jgi:hypothetical protein
MSVKHDADKIKPRLVIGSFSLALKEVSKVGTFGAQKYSEDGWATVPDGVNRYTDAMLRHYLDECAGEQCDPESTYLHAAHLAWNALARLELILHERSTTTASARSGPTVLDSASPHTRID